MSAEEEDAVQTELADLEKQLVSILRCSQERKLICLQQGLAETPKLNLPNAPRTELPEVTETGMSTGARIVPLSTAKTLRAQKSSRSLRWPPSQKELLCQPSLLSFEICCCNGCKDIIDAVISGFCQLKKLRHVTGLFPFLTSRTACSEVKLIPQASR